MERFQNPSPFFDRTQTFLFGFAAVVGIASVVVLILFG